MSRLHLSYVHTSERASAAHAGDCIVGRCPCSVLAKRLTWTQRAAMAVMVVGIIGFVVGLAEHFGIF